MTQVRGAKASTAWIGYYRQLCRHALAEENGRTTGGSSRMSATLFRAPMRASVFSVSSELVSYSNISIAASIWCYLSASEQAGKEAESQEVEGGLTKIMTAGEITTSSCPSIVAFLF